MMSAHEKAAGMLETSGAAQETTHTDSSPNSNQIANLKAQFALLGHTLQVTRHADDGRVTYIVSRWGHSRVFSHTHDVAAFLAQIGGAA